MKEKIKENREILNHEVWYIVEKNFANFKPYEKYLRDSSKPHFKNLFNTTSGFLHFAIVSLLIHFNFKPKIPDLLFHIVSTCISVHEVPKEEDFGVEGMD